MPTTGERPEVPAMKERSRVAVGRQGDSPCRLEQDSERFRGPAGGQGRTDRLDHPENYH